MKFYFSNPNRLNLDHVKEINEVRSYDDFVTRMRITDSNIVTSTDKAIFLIEVSKLTPQWTGNLHVYNSFNTILNIPFNVCREVQAGNMVVAIVSIVEGDSFLTEHWDGYKALHHDIEQRKFPANSVIIVSGNLNASNEYNNWCNAHNQKPLIKFLPGIEWDAKQFFEPANFCIDILLENTAAASFNSLNRAEKLHRKQHVDWLKEHKLISSNLVSGYGYSVDVADPLDHSLGNVCNRTIYNTSQLSVITESHFNELGLFITEKTFRSISIGHPAIILGQPRILDYLDTLGINLRFPGLDTTYDSVQDPVQRFKMFHDTLYAWTQLSTEGRLDLLNKWHPIILNNAKVYNSIDFKQQIIQDIALEADNYFLTN
jgi:hypothetical protein